jgi:hypothetical protein
VGELKERRSVSALVRNAVALMVSSMGTAGIGIVFWGVAAHLVSVESIGRASAELSAMSLLASLGSLSLGSAFIRFLPVSGNRTRMFVARSYGACTSIALVLSLVYVAAGLGHRFLPTAFVWRALFVVVVTFWVVFVLQDNALTGLRATKWVPVENLLFGIAKLALLPLFIVVVPKQGIFLAWSAPVFFAVALVTRYLFRTLIPEHESASCGRSLLPSGKEITSLLAAQGATQLVGIMSSMLMPLIVIARLGATASGYFYLPWTITVSFTGLIWSVSTSFLVEAAHDPSTMRLHVADAHARRGRGDSAGAGRAPNIRGDLRGAWDNLAAPPPCLCAGNGRDELLHIVPVVGATIVGAGRPPVGAGDDVSRHDAASDRALPLAGGGDRVVDHRSATGCDLSSRGDRSLSHGSQRNRLEVEGRPMIGRIWL